MSRIAVSAVRFLVGLRMVRSSDDADFMSRRKGRKGVKGLAAGGDCSSAVIGALVIAALGVGVASEKGANVAIVAFDLSGADVGPLVGVQIVRRPAVLGRCGRLTDVFRPVCAVLSSGRTRSGG